jgi:hypothetical protein
VWWWWWWWWWYVGVIYIHLNVAASGDILGTLESLLLDPAERERERFKKNE